MTSLYDDGSHGMSAHTFEGYATRGRVGLAAAVRTSSASGGSVLFTSRSMSQAQARLSERRAAIYGTRRRAKRVVSSTLEDVHPHDLATILDGEGVAPRGESRAQPSCADEHHRDGARFVLRSKKREDVDALLAGS